MRSLIRAFASRWNIQSVKLMTKQHLEFLGLKGGCTGSSVSALVKMPHCWISHVAAHILSCAMKADQYSLFHVLNFYIKYMLTTN